MFTQAKHDEYWPFYCDVMLGGRNDFRALANLLAFGGWTVPDTLDAASAKTAHLDLFLGPIQCLMQKLTERGFPPELHRFGLVDAPIAHAASVPGQPELSNVLGEIISYRSGLMEWDEKDTALFHRYLYPELDHWVSGLLNKDAGILGRDSKPSNRRAFAIYLGYEALLFCIFFISTTLQKNNFRIDNKVVSLAPKLFESLESSNYSSLSYGKGQAFGALIPMFNRLLAASVDDDMAWLACGCKEIYLRRGQHFMENKKIAVLLRSGRFPRLEKTIASYFIKPANSDLLEPVSGEVNGLDVLYTIVRREFIPLSGKPEAQKVLIGLEMLKLTPLPERGAYRGRRYRERQYYQYGKAWYEAVKAELKKIIQNTIQPQPVNSPAVFTKLVNSYLTMQLRNPDDRHEIPNRLTFNEVKLVYELAQRQDVFIISNIAYLFGSSKAYWLTPCAGQS